MDENRIRKQTAKFYIYIASKYRLPIPLQISYLVLTSIDIGRRSIKFQKDITLRIIVQL